MGMHSFNYFDSRLILFLDENTPIEDKVKNIADLILECKDNTKLIILFVEARKLASRHMWVFSIDANYFTIRSMTLHHRNY